MRVLLVKLTSMGDLIHALPALSDAQRVYPDIEFDWVIDESFQEVARWHPSVKKIIPSAHRRWKKNFWKALNSGELWHFLRTLRETKYDLVIDAQTNLKAALVTFLSRGVKAGFDKASAREYPAHWAYNKKYTHPKNDHAITRLRSLFAQALGYFMPTDAPNFNVQRDRLIKPSLTVPEKYLFFVHNASWVTKLWPEEYWKALIKMATEQGFNILLPSGNAQENERAKRLAVGNVQVMALPKMSLSEVGYLLSHAHAAVCVDTGLSHLSAALNIPTVTIYGATDSGLIGARSEHSKQIHLQSQFPCAPCYLKECAYTGLSKVKPACYEEIDPTRVWEALVILKKCRGNTYYHH